jgi:nifR3 family TIM-barrel protein
VPNRILLAPLAGIGNWFVRLQAKRYGAGMAVSEMVSSHAVHYGNRRTVEELLRIDPRERLGGPVSIQLFGQDPEVMRSAAATVARAGADVIDLNMGCPVPKVCKTGAGAALLSDQDRAVALARAARLGGGLPVTVKLRSGATVGDRSGLELAARLVEEAGVSAIAIHPRAAATRHSGAPDYELARELVERLPVPVILTGGLREAGRIRELFELTGAAAVMLARGALGNPWLFAQLASHRRCSARASARAHARTEHQKSEPLMPRPPTEALAPPAEASPMGGESVDPIPAEPTRGEILAELHWVLDRACEHLGAERANRYLRKFYPWYVTRLALPREPAVSLQAALQEARSLSDAREMLAAIDVTPPGIHSDRGRVEIAA